MEQKQADQSQFRLSQSERESYANARASMLEAGSKKRARPEGKPISKAESLKLGKAMLQAVLKRDQDLALSLLESGAAVNARNGDGESVLEVALSQCAQGGDMHELCAELIERGGFVAPGKYSSGAPEFTEASNKCKPLEGEILETCTRLTKINLLSQSAKWSLIRDGLKKIAPRLGQRELLTELGRLWRFGILRQAAADGVEIPKDAMNAAADKLKWDSAYQPKPTMFNSAEGKEFALLLKEPTAQSAFETKAVKAFFSAAAWESDVPALMAMLDAGLRPGADWAGAVEQSEQAPGSYRSHIVTMDAPLLAVAAASPAGRGAFEALRSFAPVVEAAKANPPGPRMLSTIAAQKLFELRDAGVDIGTTDSTGTFAHHWAKLDDKPRDGWAMLASKAPEIFEKPDGSGQRAADRMAAKLKQGAEKDAFLASLSRIESREIRKDAPAVKKKPAAAASGRGRL